MTLILSRRRKHLGGEARLSDAGGIVRKAVVEQVFLRFLSPGSSGPLTARAQFVVCHVFLGPHYFLSLLVNLLAAAIGGCGLVTDRAYVDLLE